MCVIVTCIVYSILNIYKNDVQHNFQKSTLCLTFKFNDY